MVKSIHSSSIASTNYLAGVWTGNRVEWDRQVSPPRPLLWEGQRNVLYFGGGGGSVSVRHRVRSAMVDYQPVRGPLHVF